MQRQGNTERLSAEPEKSVENNRISGSAGGNACRNNLLPLTQQPKGTWHHHQNAKKRDLAYSTENCVANGRSAYPYHSSARRSGLQRTQAGVETKDNGEKTPHIRKKVERHAKEERREHQSRGSRGRIPLPYSGTYHGSLIEEGGCHRRQQSRQPNNGKRKTKKLDEKSCRENLPPQHRCAPAVKDYVTGIGKYLRGADVGEVIVHSSFRKGPSRQDA